MEMKAEFNPKEDFFALLCFFFVGVVVGELFEICYSLTDESWRNVGQRERVSGIVLVALPTFNQTFIFLDCLERKAAVSASGWLPFQFISLCLLFCCCVQAFRMSLMFRCCLPLSGLLNIEIVVVVGVVAVVFFRKFFLFAQLHNNSFVINYYCFCFNLPLCSWFLFFFFFAQSFNIHRFFFLFALFNNL